MLPHNCAGDARGNLDLAHLVGGRAAAAQVYLNALSQSTLREMVEQKKADASRQVSTPKMSQEQLGSFIGSVGCKNLGVVKALEMLTKPIGNRLGNWVDPVHEEDGGSNEF